MRAAISKHCLVSLRWLLFILSAGCHNKWGEVVISDEDMKKTVTNTQSEGQIAVLKNTRVKRKEAQRARAGFLYEVSATAVSLSG